MKKKVLITASTFPRYEGDTEPSFILDLAVELNKIYDVTVVAPMDIDAKKKEVLNGVKVERYHYFPLHRLETLCYPGAIVPRIREKKVRGLLVPFLFVGLFLKLARCVKRYDIIISNWIIPQGIVQSMFNKPYILVGLGGDVTSLNKGILKKFKIRAMKRACAVVMVSTNLKAKAQKTLCDVPIQVIPMGVDGSKFSKNNRVDGLFEVEQENTILFVGRLAEKKGTQYLIEAMKQVKNAHLIIVGSGPEEAKLKEQSKELTDTVTFLGPKTHKELETIYASADIFVAPSIVANDGDQEGVPVAIIEAMASGLPIITCKTGGITDVVKHMENGLVCNEKDSVQLADAINYLLDNKQCRERLGSNARKRIETLDYSVIANSYAKIIDEEI